MSENEHQILGVDLGFIEKAGRGIGVHLPAESLDSQTGFQENAEDSFDAFGELMRIVEKANTSIEELSPAELSLLSAIGYRVK